MDKRLSGRGQGAYLDRFSLSHRDFSEAARQEYLRLLREDCVLAKTKFNRWLDRFHDNGNEVVLKQNLGPVKF